MYALYSPNGKTAHGALRTLGYLQSIYAFSTQKVKTSKVLAPK